MEQRKVSGNIYASPNSTSSDGFLYLIKLSNQGWGLPTDGLEPKDLRALADELEKNRQEKEQNK